MTNRLCTAPGKNVQLEVITPDDDLGIEAEEFELENALLNLVLNARDAMGGQGRVAITCRVTCLSDQPGRAAEIVELRVKATGCGIAPELVKCVLTRFFTTKPNGTGLGLANVWAFVEASRGSLAIDSQPGQGTAVILTFPRL